MPAPHPFLALLHQAAQVALLAEAADNMYSVPLVHPAAKDRHGRKQWRAGSDTQHPATDAQPAAQLHSPAFHMRYNEGMVEALGLQVAASPGVAVRLQVRRVPCE